MENCSPSWYATVNYRRTTINYIYNDRMLHFYGYFWSDWSHVLKISQKSFHIGLYFVDSLTDHLWISVVHGCHVKPLN